MENKTKKPYQPPKLVRIKLAAEQAILGACSTGVTSRSASGTKGCVSGTCRKATRGTVNSATTS